MGLREQDYYQRLGLSQTASRDEIRKAYKERAAVCHPDARFISNSEAKDREEIISYYEEMFGLISEAYETLRDEKKRAHYDKRYLWGDEDPEPEGPINNKAIPVRVKIVGKKR